MAETNRRQWTLLSTVSASHKWSSFEARAHFILLMEEAYPDYTVTTDSPGIRITMPFGGSVDTEVVEGFVEAADAVGRAAVERDAARDAIYVAQMEELEPVFEGVPLQWGCPEVDDLHVAPFEGSVTFYHVTRECQYREVLHEPTWHELLQCVVRAYRYIEQHGEADPWGDHVFIEGFECSGGIVTVELGS
jgi:hypothetical protein